MDVGTATSQSLTSYQAALQGSQAATLLPPVQAPASAPAASAAQAAPTGGLDTNSATALLASLGNAQGPSASASNNASLAIAAYQAQQSHPVSAPAVQTSPSSTPTTTIADTTGPSAAAPPPAVATPAIQDPGSNAAVQQAVQASLSPANVSLLA